MRKPDGGGRGVSDWWSIEVFDASELPARRWKDSYQDDLTEAALTNGVTLIDGRLFLMMIGRLMPPARERLLKLAMHAD